MKKFVLAAAAVVLLGTSAFAQGNSFSFKVDGQNVRVHVPKSCMSLSCISVSAPGLKDEDDEKPARTAKNIPAAPATVAAAPTPPAAAPAAAPAPAPIQQAAITAAPSPETPVTTGTAAVSAPTPPAPAPVQTTAAPTVVASAPAAAPVVPVAANSPLGIWMTEKKEGQVRIEKCGDNLCGYAIDDKTSANGKQVLINMKPKGDKWAGRIHDTRGGGTYDSTIAMRDDNSLRVQGCAFGGMFCGGQTWTRVQ